MVVGVGVDIMEVDRMRRSVADYGDQFLRHVFTEAEQEAAPKGDGKAAYYAGRWTAKEAVAKALGTGIGKKCAWKDIHISRDGNGRPAAHLTGRAAATAAALGIAHLHISISHERRLACAAAVAEA
jgi:holo-[acyl-carrier protein] synthase